MRVIGRFSGQKNSTLLIVFGAIHGNEPAGVEALKMLFKKLQHAEKHSKNFIFKGRLLGLLGNFCAFQEGKRFIEKDLNRQWTIENTERILANDFQNLEAEDSEIKDILKIINTEIIDYQPTNLVFIDLHTTTADGGFFAVSNHSAESFALAKAMKVPIIQEMVSAIGGSTLHYFTNQQFHIPTTIAGFEAGQHDDITSPHRAFAVLLHCLRYLNCVKKNFYKNNKYERNLSDFAKKLPSLTTLFYRHAIAPDDCFEMLAGFKNFDAVKKGQILAYDKNGAIFAPQDAYLLMPLYQKQGEDGFFLIV